MKNRTNWIDKYLTNNGRFVKSDAAYRKAYLLNAILTIMIFLCFASAIVNLTPLKMYAAALINAISFVFSLLTLLYFKKSNNYKPAAYLSIVNLFFSLAAFFYVTQNRHYAFYWLVILPPIVYFLLGIRAGSIALSLFSCYMLYFIFSNKITWSPAEFDAQSVFNITCATLILAIMISSYEKSRKETLNELENINDLLKNKQDELRLILDSAAEAIYGIDMNGNCTFCNKSCIKILGYNNQTDLLGKNMHWLIHHSRIDGTPFPLDECKIYESFMNGEGTHSENEVFWRADGTSFDVEYSSYPQIKDEQIIGAVVTFMDISDRRKKEAEIQYLSCYDALTGLQNRRCFEENRKIIDKPDNLPLSVIFADINELKITNDVFGHIAGDKLIKKSSEILKQICRKNDVVARVGGDEFIILLPNTTRENAEKILGRIRAGFADAHIEAIKCSISLGLDVKRSPDQSLDKIMANAENAMYKDKTLNRTHINKDIIGAIVKNLHTRSPREKKHSIAVAEICLETGTALHLPETEKSKLKRAGYLHDIGKIILDDSILLKDELTKDEFEIMQQHSVMGYRILNLFDDTLDLAEYIYAHHERWDGTGYPQGLKGEQIPMISRIISIAETYERALNRGTFSQEERNLKALEAVKNGAGTRFDPEIAEIFVQMIEKNSKNA